jgi:hypothetical protein
MKIRWCARVLAGSTRPQDLPARTRAHHFLRRDKWNTGSIIHVRAFGLSPSQIGRHLSASDDHGFECARVVLRLCENNRALTFNELDRIES